MGRVPRAILAISLIATAAGVFGYLHDPPWIADTTAGLRPWEKDEAGTLYRWTTGRATFYVPRQAAVMTLPFRATPPMGAEPIAIDIRVDDRWLGTLELGDARHPDLNAWVREDFPLPQTRSSRRYRRVDLRVRRVLGLFNLGVQLGIVETR